MSLISLLWRNVVHRITLSLLTVFSVAITVALIVFLLLFNQGLEQGAEKGYGPFEVTIGAKGSQSQLALNTYYHIGAPTGNVPLELFDKLRKEEQVDTAFAMTTGDNYNGYPIVGIDPNYFHVRYGDRKLASGILYGKLGEAVIGSHIAKSLGLKVGDTFKGAHGLVKGAVDNDGDVAEHHDFVYVIKGILPALFTSDDRAVFTTMDYAWAIHKSQQRESKDVTAILVKPKSLLGMQSIKTKYEKEINAQAIYTSKAVADVVNLVDKGSQAVNVVTFLCGLLAAISILLSLIAAVNERKKDVGLLRLIGKSKQFIWYTLIGEGLLLTVIGIIIGLLAGHVGGYLSRDIVFEFSGLQISPWHIQRGEWLLVLGTVAVGILASVGPALKAYRVDPLQLFRS
jgi:putative ABC transport system permease protein